MPQPLKVGIISGAWGAYAHLPAWRSLDDVEVVAICTSRPETAQAAAEAHGVMPFWDYHEMARHAEIDIIDAGTRPPLRMPMVSAALESGKHAYAGMPFGMNAKEAQQMASLAKQRGLVGCVDAFIQATPAAQLMKRMIGEGFLGHLSGVRCNFHQQLFTESAVNVPTYAWFGDASQGASALRNLGGHALHTIVSLLGGVSEVVGHGSRVIDRWKMDDGSVRIPEVDDHSSLLFRLENGVVGQLSLAWSATDASGYLLEAWGTGGRLVLQSPSFPQAHNTTLLAGTPGGLSDQNLAPVSLPEDLTRIQGSALRADDPAMGVFPMAAIFRDMVDAIRNGGNAEPSFEQAAHVSKIIDAIELSYRERKWTTVTPRVG